MKLRTKLFIASRHLRSRAFQTFSVAAVVAFSVGLAVALFLVAQGLRLGLVHAVEPFELIVGAKGSPYQLLLNTVFLQDAEVQKGRRRPNNGESFVRIAEPERNHGAHASVLGKLGVIFPADVADRGVLKKNRV